MADPTYQLILPPGVNQQEILDAIAKGQVALNAHNELVILDGGITPQSSQVAADPVTQIAQQIATQVCFYMLFTSCISGHGNITGPLFPSVHLSVFPSVCPYVSTLTPVPLSIWF